MTAIPPPPAHAVERPRLRSRLDATLNAPLSVVVAPAGSGKTVLLSQWATSVSYTHLTLPTIYSV